MLLMQWLVWIVVLLAAVATCSLAIFTGARTSEIGWVLQLAFLVPASLFATSAYMFLGWQNLRAKNMIQVVVILAGSILLTAYGITTLYARLSRHDDAFRGVWFFVVPIYQWMACGVLALVTISLRKIGTTDKDGSGPHRGDVISILSGAPSYDSLPWYRRSGVLSKFTAVGILFAPALLPVCVAVLTGPVYYRETTNDGSLRTWGMLNKAAALTILSVEGYLYGSILFW